MCAYYKHIHLGMSQDNWAERWKKATEKAKCFICEKRDESYKMIKCAGPSEEEGCPENFVAHKMCIDPLRDWNKEEKEKLAFVCDICIEEICEICEKGDREDELLICDNCDRAYHWDCIKEGGPSKEEFHSLVEEGSEGDWYCPECEEEYASDREWAKEHIVDDEELDEEWTRAECDCGDIKDCVVCGINDSVDNWKNFNPENPIQAALKNAIDSKEHIVNTIMDNMKFVQEGRQSKK